MNGAPERLRNVRQWVAKAENDLRNAEHTLTLQEECPFDTVCFHAQQCAEKYLKYTHAGADRYLALAGTRKSQSDRIDISRGGTRQRGAGGGTGG